MELWLDPWAYAGRLFLAGRELPWLDPAAFVDLARRIDGLLRPNRLLLDSSAFYTAYLRASPQLRDELSQPKRPSLPLRRLLADPGGRTALVALFDALTASGLRSSVVVFARSPAAALPFAYGAATGVREPPDFDPDDLDRAGTLLADWLRAFSGCAMCEIVVERDASASIDETSALDPIVNACDFYHWQLGGSNIASARFAFELRARAVEERWVHDLADVVDCATLAPRAVFARIRADAEPEAVIAGTRSLTAS